MFGCERPEWAARLALANQSALPYDDHMGVISTARALFHNAGRIDRSQIGYVIPLRNALGVVIPLAVGAATGHLVAGLTACIGAMNSAYSDSPGPYRLRLGQILLVALASALSVFVGSIVGAASWAGVLILACWGFGGGFLVALGPAATQIGITSIILLLVFSDRPASPGDAAGLAALILLGAALQGLLAVAAWPVRRFGPQRQALSRVFHQLSVFAQSSSDPNGAPAVTGVITQARTVLTGLGSDHSAGSEALRALLDEAERIRLEMVTLEETRYGLAGTGAEETVRQQIDDQLRAAGAVLALLAQELLSERRSAGIVAELHRMDRATATVNLISESDWTSDSNTRLIVLTRMEALAGQIRATVEIALHGSQQGEEAVERAEAARPPALRLREPLAILRANVTVHSAACRHALRLAASLVIASTLAHALGQPRTYWIPMTAALVLKPDFGATYTRGLARILGTLFGLLLATALVYSVFGAVPARIALIGILMFAVRSVGPINYALLTCISTAQVVVLISFAGARVESTILERGAYTLLGGAIALIAYALWPTWERTQTPKALARLLECYRRYFNAVMTGYLDPSQVDPVEISAARHASRLARSNAESSVDRLAAEPARSAKEYERATSLLAHSHRLARSMMALEAAEYAGEDLTVPLPLQVFVRDVDTTLQALEQALRNPDYPLNTLPDLRADQRELSMAAHSAPVAPAQAPVHYRLALLAYESDRITDSVNTLAQLLRNVT